MNKYKLVYANEDFILVDMERRTLIGRFNKIALVLKALGEAHSFEIEMTQYRGDFICELLKVPDSTNQPSIP